MRGTIKDVFDLSWGLTLAVEAEAGSAKAGDRFVVGGREWIISGVPMVKRVQQSDDNLISVTLADADRGELQTLVGHSFETLPQ